MKKTVSGMLRLLGRGRAAPRPDMALSVPAPYRRAAELETDARALGRRLAAGRGPLEGVRDASRYLDQLNRSAVGADVRWELTNVAMAALGPAAVSLYSRYSLEPGDFPESEERRLAMGQAITAVERAAVSYKLVLAHDWGLSRRAYEARRERVRHCALVIMELIRLEQWLRALRRQRLPRRAWHDIHEIYFALCREEPVARTQPLKVRFALHPGARNELPLVLALGSLEQVYASIQLVGLLDVAAAASVLPYVAQNYLDHLGAPLAVSPYDGSSPIPAGHVLAYRGRQGPAGFKRIPDQTGEAVLIDVGPLREMLARDHAGLTRDPAHPIKPAAVAALPPERRLALITAMLQRLQPRSRREARRPVYDTQYAGVYFGFAETFRLLRDLTQDSPLLNQDRAFRDALAEHSAKLDSSDDGVEARWLVVNVSAGGIQLAVQEGRFTVPIHIGGLVAYRLLADASPAPRVGYVVRLHRAGERDMELAIEALGQSADSVVVQHADGADPERLLPAILLRDTDGASRLVIAECEGLAPGAALYLHAQRRRHAARLGDLVLSQPGFNVYSLRRGN